MAALGIGATVIAVPRAISGMTGVPQIVEAGISRTAAETPSSKPSTAKMPIWSAPANTATPDTRPPSPVTGLRVMANSESTISLAWDAGQDNVAVKLYVVKGDGFAPVQTADTKATVSWPHRTSSVSVMVSAVDTSGNQGQWRSLVVVPPVTVTTTATTAPVVAPTTAPATTTTPDVTTTPSDVTTTTTTGPASSGAASTGSTQAASSASTAVQSAAVQDPGTAGAMADPSSAQPS